MPLPPPSPTTTALVTGASSGIGTELARQLARRGLGVTLVARRRDRLEALAAELAGTWNVRAEVVPADLADASSRRALLHAVAGLGLEVAVLVNNAGFSTSGPVGGADPERELAMVRTDVEAVVDLCTRLVPAMAQRGQGAVLNVASTAGFQPLPGQAGYGASKAFVLSYSQALRAELAGSGVGVSVLCPGPVRTEFAETAGFTKEEAESSLPSVMWLPAAQVAAKAVDGLAQGRGVIIPGIANGVGARVSYAVPRRLLLPVLARRHPALRAAARGGSGAAV